MEEAQVQQWEAMEGPGGTGGGGGGREVREKHRDFLLKSIHPQVVGASRSRAHYRVTILRPRLSSLLRYQTSYSREIMTMVLGLIYQVKLNLSLPIGIPESDSQARRGESVPWARSIH
jgi:hypothetical protein